MKGDREMESTVACLLEQSHTIAGAKEAVGLFERMIEDFLALLQHSEVLSKDLERMSSLASSPPALSEQLFENINRSFVSYSKLSERVEFRACKLNYHTECLEKELNHFLKVSGYNQMHNETIEMCIANHVRNSIDVCEQMISSLESFL
jgi:hypothetical protein